MLNVNNNTLFVMCVVLHAWLSKRPAIWLKETIYIGLATVGLKKTWPIYVVIRDYGRIKGYNHTYVVRLTRKLYEIRPTGNYSG